MRRSDPPGHPPRGPRRPARHRSDPLTCRIGPLVVRTHEILPASCAAAIPVSSSPAPKPRVPPLDRADRASSVSITPSRSHSTLTAARPAFAVSDRSGAPARTCCQFRLPPVGVPPNLLGRASTTRHVRPSLHPCSYPAMHVDLPTHSRNRVKELHAAAPEPFRVRSRCTACLSKSRCRARVARGPAPAAGLNGQTDQPKRLMPTHPRVRKHGRS
jgi:hypothetical protein